MRIPSKNGRDFFCPVCGPSVKLGEADAASAYCVVALFLTHRYLFLYFD